MEQLHEKMNNSADDVKSEKHKILKTILCISIAFTLFFTAFLGLAYLQSSLHSDEGIGTVTQSALYVAVITSCLFLVKPSISVTGHRWTIVISMSAYCLWFAANG